LSRTHQPLIYADVHLLGGSTNTTEKNAAEALITVNEEVGLGKPQNILNMRSCLVVGMQNKIIK
jgi:hypothetical protein